MSDLEKQLEYDKQFETLNWSIIFASNFRGHVESNSFSLMIIYVDDIQ